MKKIAYQPVGKILGRVSANLWVFKDGLVVMYCRICVLFIFFWNKHVLQALIFCVLKKKVIARITHLFVFVYIPSYHVVLYWVLAMWNSATFRLWNVCIFMSYFLMGGTLISSHLSVLTTQILCAWLTIQNQVDVVLTSTNGQLSCRSILRKNFPGQQFLHELHVMLLVMFLLPRNVLWHAQMWGNVWLVDIHFLFIFSVDVCMEYVVLHTC